MANGLEPIDVGVLAIGTVGVLTFLGYIFSLRCPKCRSSEIVDHGKFCRFCGDDLDAITGSFKWIGRMPLVVLPLTAAIVSWCVFLDRIDYAFWSMLGAFAVLLVRNIFVTIAFGCSGCGAAQLVTRKNLFAQKYCSFCGARV